jgi:hypothetical protein
MRFATTNLFLLFCSLAVYGQTAGKGTVTGRVASNGKAVSGCVITVLEAALQ